MSVDTQDKGDSPLTDSQSKEGTGDGHGDGAESGKAADNGEGNVGTDSVVEVPKYTDPHKLAEVLENLEEKVFDTETGVARLNVKVLEMERQIQKINDELDRIEPLPEEPPDPKDGLDLPELKLVSRVEWNAFPPKTMETMKPLSKPIAKVNITYLSDTDPCETQAECLNTVAELQKKQMREGLPDIAHNFLIGEDGYVYEGRGWDLTPHIEHYPTTEGVLDVAFIGNYTAEMFPLSLLSMLSSLMNKGFEDGIVHEDYENFHVYEGKILKLH